MRTENIAAILIEGCKTVSVTFEQRRTLKHKPKYNEFGDRDRINDFDDCEESMQSEEFTYKTMDTLVEGDKVVVRLKNEFKIATVSSIHTIPQIDMDSSIRYRWIIQKIDLTEYKRLNRTEKEFKNTLLEVEQNLVKEQAKALLVEKYGIKAAQKLVNITKEANCLLEVEANDDIVEEEISEL